VPEPPAAIEPDERPGQNPILVAFVRIGETLRELKAYRHALLMMLAFLAYSDGIGTIIRMAALYAAELKIPTQVTISCILLVQFVGIPFAVLFGRIADRIGEIELIEGSAIACIASTAGIGWMQNLGMLFELLATPGFDAARAWCEAHPKELSNAYGLSKEAINAYTAVRSFPLAAQGIRLNCVNPGPTDTPMMPEFEKAIGKQYMDDFPIPLGRHAVAEEQAWPMVFLNSPRCSFVTGTQFECDGGFKGGLFTGQIDPSVLMPE
jgi:NAD(P)-dependent dehydrogenase (short-subunit alcohol dehydrogenase family)